MKNKVDGSIRTLADHMHQKDIRDGYLPVGMSGCDSYGMRFGCDGGCPVFIEGKCRLEDVDAFRKAIIETDRFDNWEIDELNEVYPQLNL